VTKQFHNVLSSVTIAKERRLVADGSEFAGGADDGLAVCPQKQIPPGSDGIRPSGTSRRVRRGTQKM